LPGDPCFPRLRLDIAASGLTLCTHGPDTRKPPSSPNPATTGTSTANAPTTTAPTTTTTPTTAALCYGDGQAGDRVQLIYAHGPNVADAYNQALPSLRQVAGQLDGIMSASAAQVGQVRHYRFVTDASCNVLVANVAMSAGARDDFSTMVNELIDKGYGRSDRKYLVFGDAASYCGIAGTAPDDRPSQYNRNDALGYARIDRGCWDSFFAGHELMHALGSVQMTAPHAAGEGHCNDNYDIMCNTKATSPCPQADVYRYDCNKDDYFNPGTPPAGTYLATHWNTAYSLFLETRNGTTTSPGPAISPPPSPVPPAPRRTQSYSGVATLLTGSIYDLVTGDGPMTATASASAPVGITVTVQDGSGTIIGSRHGVGSVTVSGIVLGGTQRFTVSSDSATQFSMIVDYPGA
jgi:hypothetical protein